jgi:signal transduction histidine kinase
MTLLPRVTRPVVIDVALALVFGVLAFIEGISHSSTGYLGSAPPLESAVIGAAGAIPLLFRRRYPLRALIATVLIVTVPHLFASVDLLFVGGIILLGVNVASVAYFRRLPFNVIGLVSTVPGFVLFCLVIPRFAGFGELVFDGVLMVLAFGVGTLFSLAVERNALLRRELATQREAEKLRTEAAAARERATIARELHDVIAHCVSLMVVQAGSARVQFPTKPDESVRALANIEATGREALTELRRVLDVLHTEARDDESTPRFDHLERLVSGVRSAGLDVTVEVIGDRVPLPPGLDLSAYRIVQESLTNALKHGDGRRAELRVQFFEDRLEIDVRNAVTHRSGTRALPGGNGLAGMRERARAFGGQLTTDANGDVFRVHVMIPLALAAA